MFVTPFRAEVEGGHGERARVDVRRDHFAGVAGEQERLDPVAGADVERPLDGLRIVKCASTADGRCTPATRSATSSRSGRDQEVVVRDDPDEPAQ